MKLCDTCIYGDKYELEKPCVIYSDGCKLYEEKKMDDMTRKRAISELNQIYGMLSPDKQRALDVAINLLKIDEQYDLMYEELDFVKPKKVVGRMIDIKVLEDIKTEITEKIAYQEKRISKLDNTHTYPSPKPRPVEFSVIPRNPQEIALVKRDGIIEGYENSLEIIDKHMRGEET